MSYIIHPVLTAGTISRKQTNEQIWSHYLSSLSTLNINMHF